MFSSIFLCNLNWGFFNSIVQLGGDVNVDECSILIKNIWDNPNGRFLILLLNNVAISRQCFQIESELGGFNIVVEQCDSFTMNLWQCFQEFFINLK